MRVAHPEEAPVCKVCPPGVPGYPVSACIVVPYEQGTVAMYCWCISSGLRVHTPLVCAEERLEVLKDVTTRDYRAILANMLLHRQDSCQGCVGELSLRCKYVLVITLVATLLGIAGIGCANVRQAGLSYKSAVC